MPFCFKFENNTFMPYFTKRFWNIYDDISNIKPIVKRFVYLMHNRKKLVNRGISRLKSFFNKKWEHFIKDTIKPLQLFVEKHQFFNQNNQ